MSALGLSMDNEARYNISAPCHPHTGCIINLTIAEETVTPDGYEQLYLVLQLVTGLGLYPIFCTFGLVGNVISFIVLSSAENSTYTYLKALAVSDSLKLLNDTLYFFTILFLHTDPPFGQCMYAYLYPYAHYFFNMSTMTTAWITVSVAAERYIYVCHPIRAKLVCSLPHARWLCAIVFIISALITLPFGLRYRTIIQMDNITKESIPDVEVTELWLNQNFVKTYQWTQTLVKSFIPLFILSIFNYFIIHALRQTRAARRMTSKYKTTLMLLAVIILFLVCITPDALMSAVLGYGYYDAGFLARAAREITDFLLLVNSSVNFILYCVFNQKFRKRFVFMFCRCLCSKHELSRAEFTLTRQWYTTTDKTTAKTSSETAV